MNIMLIAIIADPDTVGQLGNDDDRTQATCTVLPELDTHCVIFCGGGTMSTSSKGRNASDQLPPHEMILRAYGHFRDRINTTSITIAHANIGMQTNKHSTITCFSLFQSAQERMAKITGNEIYYEMGIR